MSPLVCKQFPMNSPGVMAAKIWIKGGSRNDPEGKKGIHQLIGSLMSRGCGPYDNLALADLVEGCGAGLRCDTHEDGILISLKCVEKDAMDLIPILGWMIVNPLINSDQFNLERELTLQSLQRQKENPFHLAFDGWRQLAFHNGPYAHDPLGIKEDLQNLSKEDTKSFADQLKGLKQVLVITGTIPNVLSKSLQEIQPFNELLNKEFIECGGQELKINRPTNSQINSTCCLHPENTEQVVLLLGQATIPHNHPDDLLLRLIGCHLGAGMSSYLFKQLREIHGVAYDVGVHHPVRESKAPFLLHAATSKEKAHLTLQLLRECWHALTERRLSNDELLLAKAKFRGQLAHNSQTVSQIAERKVHLMGIGMRDDYDKSCLEKIESITSKELHDVAIRHLQSPLLSLCGPASTINKLALGWDG